MSLFGFKKRERVIDLGARYRKQQEQIAAMKEEASDSGSISRGQSASAEGFNFLGNMASANSGSSNSSGESSDEYAELGGPVENRRRKLAKRLMEMTEKIEDLNNQIYHLQQRIEVLERKSGVGSY